MARPVESIVHGSKATLHQLPSVDRVLRLASVRELIEQHGHTLVATQCRDLLEDLRQRAKLSLDPSELHDSALTHALRRTCGE
jgi:L-seryl-tRNA(Ser) seleniumtransferase